MNRRRRYGGAEDVPTSLWDEAEVDQAVTNVAICAQEEGFDGDWDTAPLRLEESLAPLAMALRWASAKRPTRHWGQERVPLPSQEAQVGKSQIPIVVRRDVGSQALSDYLSWIVQSDRVLQKLRQRVCGGEDLTREEVWLFLTSPLPKVMGFEDYERRGLCPARTVGRIVSRIGSENRLADRLCPSEYDGFLHLHSYISWGYGAYTYGIEVQVPGDSEETPMERLELERQDDDFIFVSKGNLLGLASVKHSYATSSGAFPEVTPYFSDGRRFVEGYWESVTADLIRVAGIMCRFYRVTLWDMLETLVTGVFPAQPAVEANAWNMNLTRFGFDYTQNCFTAQGPVTLTVQPWVTPEALADAWREHRKTNPCYSPSEKQAEALRFVLAHTPPGEEFAWERLARQWQEERGELMTRGQLFKQFQRARAAILPGYRDLGGE